MTQPINPLHDCIARRRIAGEAPVTERRVLLAYREPEAILPCTFERVRRAAIALGYAPPNPPVARRVA